jgi:ABC-type branched-subunit amino acid transport system substrate-binding protein
MQRLYFIFILTFVPVSFFTNGVSAIEDNPPDRPPLTKTFGCLLPLNGKYKIVGEKALRGILTAAELAGAGSEYRIVVKDIGDSQAKLSSALASLTAIKDLSFIVGPIPSKFISAVSPAVDSSKIPTVVFPISGSETAGGPYIIKFYYPLEEQARTLASFAVSELGVRSFAVLYPATSLGEGMKNEFIKSLRSRGGNIVYEGSYDNQQRDIGDEVKWIASSGAHGVFIADGAGASAEIIFQLKKAGGLSDVLFLGPSTWNGSLFLDLTGSQIDGFVYRAVFTDFFIYGSAEWSAFSKQHESRFDGPPSFLEYQSYLAVRLLLSTADDNSPGGGGLMEKLLSLQKDRRYRVKKDKSGSLQISPRYLILSVAKGELSEIMSVK